MPPSLTTATEQGAGGAAGAGITDGAAAAGGSAGGGAAAPLHTVYDYAYGACAKPGEQGRSVGEELRRGFVSACVFCIVWHVLRVLSGARVNTAQILMVSGETA